MTKPFIKQVLQAYSNPKKYVVRPQIDKPIPPKGMRELARRDFKTREMLRRATKFTLDDDFAEYAAWISCQLTTEDVIHCLWKSKTPYPTMWVEWDGWARQKGIERICGPGGRFTESHKLGMLFRPVDDSENCQLATLFQPDPDTPIYTREFPVKIVWTSEPNVKGVQELRERARRAMGGLEFYKTEKEISITAAELVGQIIFWGSTWMGEQDDSLKIMRSLPEEEMIQTVEDLADDLKIVVNAVALGFEGAGSAHMALAQKLVGPKEAMSMLAEILREMVGEIRWIVTFLAMLNSFETFTGPSEFISGARVGMAGKINKPYMEFRTLGIKLPKQKKFTTVRARLKEGLPRRAHQVRGNYMTRWAGEPLPVEKWRWRPSHQRGDASLGFVHKDYNVELGNDASEE